LHGGACLTNLTTLDTQFHGLWTNSDLPTQSINLIIASTGNPLMSQSTQYPPGPAYKMPGKLVREFIGDPIKMLTKVAQQYGDISYFKLGREQG
jgi:hypothetical protein